MKEFLSLRLLDEVLQEPLEWFRMKEFLKEILQNSLNEFMK